MSGIYIHIPFCAQKCTYCDFHFSTTFEGYRSRMLQAVEHEIGLRSGEFPYISLRTIYFGGGTPGLLTEKELTSLLEKIHTHYDCSFVEEITLECNPDDCSSSALLSWKKIGINRLSIGIQSFDDEQLQWMNRTHTANEALQAVNRAKAAGFETLSIDLMYGLPHLSLEKWHEQLKQAVALEIPHISAYCLTVEKGTLLADYVRKGILVPSDNDLQSDQFDFLRDFLTQNGYEHYEISNFACNGQYSRHNTSYWTGATYVGIGPSAHGFSGEKRYWNISNNARYIRDIEQGKLPQTEEFLRPNDRFNETMMIGLRTMWGTEKKQLFECAKPPSEWFLSIERLKSDNQLTETATHFLLTPSGRLRADAIAAELFLLEDT